MREADEYKRYLAFENLDRRERTCPDGAGMRGSLVGNDAHCSSCCAYQSAARLRYSARRPDSRSDLYTRTNMDPNLNAHTDAYPYAH
jgi:hypothetical protein